MVSRVALLLVLLVGCGPGLKTAPDAGPLVLPPKDCMRALSDDKHVPQPPAPDSFFGVEQIAFDADGQLYVLDRAGDTGRVAIFVFSKGPNHSFVRSYGATGLERAIDFALDASGQTFVLQRENTQSGHPKVTVLNASGAQVREWKLQDAGIDEGFSIAVDRSGQVITGGDAISRFSPQGALLASFGMPGVASHHIGWPRGLLVDSRGPLWVADLARNMVLEFDPQDNLVLELGGRGAAPGQFDGTETDPEVVWGPSRLAVDANGNLYANDPDNSRVQKLSRQGAGLAQFGFEGSRNIGSVAIDPQRGYLYVARGTGIDILCPL